MLDYNQCCLFTCLFRPFKDQKPDESGVKQLQAVSEAEDTASAQQSTEYTDDSESHSEDTPAQENKNDTFTETAETNDHEEENVKTEASETCEASSATLNNSQVEVTVDKIPASEVKPAGEQSKTDTDVYNSDYRFGLRLRVHYRINEEAIRCLLLVRWVAQTFDSEVSALRPSSLA